MINYLMDLLAGPQGQLAFRTSGAEEFPAWRHFYWNTVTGWLDIERLRDDEVLGWAPVHYSPDLLSELVPDALAHAAQSQVAIRIPSHADKQSEMAWLGWWVSEAGLTVQLMTETEVLDWTPLYREKAQDV